MKPKKNNTAGPFATATGLLLVCLPLAHGGVLQSHMDDPQGITSLLESGFWGFTATREGTAYSPGAPKDQFNLTAFNLGAVSNLATWAISDFTAYAPPAPYAVNENQLSESNTYGETALQADGLAWGGYMRSADWNGQGNRMTLRYNYKWSDAPSVFSDGASEFKCLRVGLNLAVPLYNGPSPATSTDQLGWCVVNVVFRDLASEQFLTFICTVFDTRGFRTENGMTVIGGGGRKENSARVSSGEMVVYGMLADHTRYNTKLPNSSDSRILPFSEKVFFGYSLSRDQVNDIIEKANDWLADHPSDPGSMYSTDLNDWVLWEANVGVEASRMEAGSFAMSYIGDHFDIFSEYKVNGLLIRLSAVDGQ